METSIARREKNMDLVRDMADAEAPIRERIKELKDVGMVRSEEELEEDYRAFLDTVTTDEYLDSRTNDMRASEFASLEDMAIAELYERNGEEDGDIANITDEDINKRIKEIYIDCERDEDQQKASEILNDLEREASSASSTVYGDHYAKRVGDQVIKANYGGRYQPASAGLPTLGKRR